MRIISKFQDYYDISMAYGQDENLVWVRNTEEIPMNHLDLRIKKSWFSNYHLNTRNKLCDVDVTFLAFCGKLYPIHTGKTRVSRYSSVVDVTLHTNSVDEMKEAFTRFTGEDLKYADKDQFPFWMSKVEIVAFHDWLKKPCHDLHTKFDCPVLLLTEKKVIKCPKLLDFKFQRVKDSFTAYQEISMYISGVMGQQQNPTVTISDKSKILKHGFDPKYGFRKRK